MSIDYSNVTGLSDHIGNIVKITDASGNVLWAVKNNKPVVLQVEKITSDTYAGETTYTGEQFILLDIYPKTANSTVDVTYGGLTKTLTFTGTNAQQVFFGTFNGVSDEVETPASGELTIEGEYDRFAVGTYKQKNTTTNKTDTHYCGCITSVIDWGSLTSIGKYAFYNCTNLTLTELPEGPTSIGDYAFYGCTGITLSSLPSGITSIGSYAFTDCTGITLSSLPNGITSIGTSAFDDCTGITLSSLPNGITSIGVGAFRDCTGITLSSLPNGITSIENSAFYNCTNLALTELPEGLTSIGDSAFYLCTGITLSSLPNGITSIGKEAFTGCTGITLSSLPSGVTSIGERAFKDCTGITLSSLPSGITSIGNSAFYSCTNLALTELPEGLTSIGNYAFWVEGVPRMEGVTLTLPSTLESIGESVFVAAYKYYITGYPTYIKKVVMLAEVPPTVAANSFGSANEPWIYYRSGTETNQTLQIVVPKGCSEAYKSAAVWSENAECIVEAE